MRVDRSLIPGLGAGLSLLAAISCAFFVTAALLAFHGWPRGARTGAARALVVAADSRRVRAILVSAARPPGNVAKPIFAAAGAGSIARTPRTLASTRPRGALVALASSPPSAPAVPARHTPLLASAPVATPPHDLAAVTRGTSTSVAALVTGVTGGLAATVAPISPAVSGTVAGLGGAVGGTVITVGSQLADVLRGFAATR